MMSICWIGLAGCGCARALEANVVAAVSRVQLISSVSDFMALSHSVNIVVLNR